MGYTLFPAPAPYASSTVPGILSTGAQDIAGPKTFTHNLYSNAVLYAGDSTTYANGNGVKQYIQKGTVPGDLNLLHGATLYVVTEATRTTNREFAVHSWAILNPPSASTALVRGLSGVAQMVGAYNSGATAYGIQGEAQYAATAGGGTAMGVFGAVSAQNGLDNVTPPAGTLTNAFGGRFISSQTIGSHTWTNAYGVYIENGSTLGTVTNRAGLLIDEATGGGKNANLVLGATAGAFSPSSGNYSLYSASTRASFFNGELQLAAGLKSTVADGGSAVAFVLDTSTAYSTSGAKLASFKNNGTEKVSIDKDGILAPGTDAGPTLGSAGNRWAGIYGTGLYDASAVARMSFGTTASSNSYMGTAADGAAAIGHIFDTNVGYANATAKIASFKTGGTEKNYINKDGKLSTIALVAPPTVTGAKAGNAALGSLITQLAAQGIIIDSTS